jgi:hypothetical protein
LLEGHFDELGNGLHVTVTGARSDDEIIGVTGATPYVDDDYIESFSFESDIHNALH